MPKKKLEEPCENAETNPICPYITQINNITNQISTTNSALSAATSATNTAMIRLDSYGNELREIKKALIGEDLTGGIVKKIADLEASLKTAASWANFGKPIILGVIMAVIAGVISRLI